MQSLRKIAVFWGSVNARITFGNKVLCLSSARSRCEHVVRCKQTLTDIKGGKFSQAERHLSCSTVSGRKLVLGIETSFDDTGAAVVDNEGNVLGEALESQTKVHVE